MLGKAGIRVIFLKLSLDTLYGSSASNSYITKMISFIIEFKPNILIIYYVLLYLYTEDDVHFKKEMIEIFGDNGRKK